METLPDGCKNSSTSRRRSAPFGFVTTRTDWYEFIQVFGLFLLGAGLLVLSLGLLLQPAEEAQEEAGPLAGDIDLDLDE